MDKNIELKYLIEEISERKFKEMEILEDFIQDLNDYKSDLVDFCNLTRQEVLYICGTNENGHIEPCYVFLTTPSKQFPEGIYAYNIGNIVCELEKIKKL